MEPARRLRRAPAVAASAVPTDQERKWISFDQACINQRDKTISDGTATVIAPTCQSVPTSRTVQGPAHQRRRATYLLGERLYDMTDNVIQPADIREVAVIGLGLMGSGIAELVARSGRRVVAIEINQDFLDQGMARLHASLDKAVTRGKLTDTAREEILARIWPTDNIAAGVAERRPGDRGHTRTDGPQADPVRPAGRGLPGRRDPGHQHLLAVGHRDRGRHPVSRPGRGAALLQSRAGHEAGRGHLHGAHLAGHHRDAGPAGPGPGQDSRSRSATGPGSSSTRCWCPTSTTQSGCWKPPRPPARTSTRQPPWGSACRWDR